MMEQTSAGGDKRESGVEKSNSLDWQKLLETYEEADEKKRVELIGDFYSSYLKNISNGKEISFEIPAADNLGEIRKFFGDIIKERVGDENLDDVEVIAGELVGNLIRHGRKEGGNVILQLTPDRFYFAIRNKADNLFEKGEDGSLNFMARDEEEKQKIDKINKDIRDCFNVNRIEVSERDGTRLEKYFFTSKVENYEYAGLDLLNEVGEPEKVKEKTKKECERERSEREGKMLQEIECRGQGIGLSACLMNKTDEFIIVVERDKDGTSRWVTMGINRDRHPKAS